MKTKTLLTLAILAATTLSINVSANTDVSTKVSTTTTVTNEQVKVETPTTSVVNEPFVIQSEKPTTTATTTETTTSTAPIETTTSTEPVTLVQSNTHPSISQIRILPVTTIYVADETITEGQEKLFKLVLMDANLSQKHILMVKQ